MQAEALPQRIAFNLFPHVDVFLDNGYTKEEMKFVNESRKIMHHPTLKISATCVRVPVYRAHSEAVNIEFERPMTPAEARAILAKAPGVKVVDDPGQQEISDADRRVGNVRLPGGPDSAGCVAGRRTRDRTVRQRRPIAQGRGAQRGADRGTAGLSS